MLRDRDRANSPSFSRCNSYGTQIGQIGFGWKERGAIKVQSILQQMIVFLHRCQCDANGWWWRIFRHTQFVFFGNFIQNMGFRWDYTKQNRCRWKNWTEIIRCEIGSIAYRLSELLTTVLLLLLSSMLNRLHNERLDEPPQRLNWNDTTNAVYLRRANHRAHPTRTM